MKIYPPDSAGWFGLITKDDELIRYFSETRLERKTHRRESLLSDLCQVW